MTNSGQQWWRSAVIYQIYPRSFADSDGDGYGDLPGIIDRLDHLAQLGADAVWLSPFYLSPMADAGYDVADYFRVDPLFGSDADADRLLERARELGLRVIIDLVPNHTSDQHAWFRRALEAGPGSPERDFYIFHDGKGHDGSEPPNNWTSVFGGSGWTRLSLPDGTPEQWYLHLFDVHQPDLNWDNEAVREGFDEILRFWLDKGVDGFRVDVAHGLVKAEGLPDESHHAEMLDSEMGPAWDQDGVHDIYRRWRRILDTYPHEPALVAEAWVPDPERIARYVREDEMHQAFNFNFLTSDWEAADYREVIDTSLRTNDAVGAPTTWVLSNHDVVRHATRLAREDPTSTQGIGEGDPIPDPEVGLRRARAATLLMFALPGSAYVYQGEELGLPDSTEVPNELRQDPTWFRSDHEHYGRDGCRIPMPWEAAAAGLGFSPNGSTWLPQPDSYRDLAADQQVGVEGTTWAMYRDAIRLRREFDLPHRDIEWNDSEPHVLDFTSGPVRVMVNVDGPSVRLPEGHAVVLASGQTDDGELPIDTAVWLKQD